MLRVCLNLILSVAIALDLSATRPPNCIDGLSQRRCQDLLSSNATTFKHWCETNAEFVLLDCCISCGALYSPKDLSTVKNTAVNTNCSDISLVNWCERFTSGQVNTKLGYVEKCDGPVENNLAYAFRLCRKSCGYCGPNQTVTY
uniref:ShKT domain-containing protein n=1 Tax=Acrobeloides nanus TaxID=290746 RepID=A0A914D305_9BILA